MVLSTSSHGLIWFIIKCFQLMLHVDIIVMISINRNHQGREMCTSRKHNKFTWSGLMIYEMIFVRDWLILYPYLLNFSTYFYLIYRHQFRASNSRWSVFQLVTLVLSFHVYVMGWFALCKISGMHLVRWKCWYSFPPNGQSWRRSSLQSVLHFPLRVRWLKTVCI